MTDATNERTVRSRAGRPWLRYLAIFVIAIVAVGMLAIAAGFIGTSGPAKAGDAFLATLAKSGPTAAYDSAAPSFRQVAPVAKWEAFARASGLATNTGARWTSRQVRNNEAQLDGTVRTAEGEGPLMLKLVKDASGWRVGGLQFRGGRGSVEATPTAVNAADDAMRGEELAAGGGQPNVAAAGAPATQPRPGYPSPGLNAVSPPPAASALGARAEGDGLSAGLSTVPAAKVAGICMSLLQSQNLPISGVECPQGLVTTPGATTRCVVRSGAGRVGMTVALRSYDPVSTRPALACVVDVEPIR